MRSHGLGLGEGSTQRPHIEDRFTAAVKRRGKEVVRRSIKRTCLRCNMIHRLALYVSICSGHMLERAVAEKARGACWAVAVTRAGYGAFAGYAA
jgi:hypothetical protein